jgi:hypothetical protein
VRIGERYGVFYAWEFSILLGMKLRFHPTENAATVLARYGAPEPKERPP